MADKMFADNFKLVERLVKAGASLDEVDENGNSALHHAVLNNHPRMIALLAKHGADITLKNNDFLTAIQLAAAKKHWGCVGAFALNRRDDNHEACYGSALASAVKADKFDTVKKLLDARADLNWVTGAKKNGVLHSAVKNNHPRMVSVLVSAGANPTYRNRNGKTASQLAADQHKWRCANFIADYVNNPRHQKPQEQKSLSAFGLWKQKHFHSKLSNELDVTPEGDVTPGASPTMK